MLSASGSLVVTERHGASAWAPASHGEDDLSLGVSFAQVPQRVGSLAQRVAPVYDRCDLFGREKLLEHEQVRLVDLRHEVNDLLAAPHGGQTDGDDMTQRSDQTVALRRSNHDEG